MFWGITPSLNLFDEVNIGDRKCLNILLVGGSDARHILRTVAKRYEHQDVTVNFYVMELIPEAIAKEMLLLNIALQPVRHLGLAPKTRMFMEIYGNTLITPASAKYLINRGQSFIKMITNLEHMKAIMPNVTVDLKYKERDYIENLFKFWVCADQFNILDYWDRRLRRFLGVRYDTRNGAFDWDLHMRLHHIGAKIIHTQEYLSFRKNGVAFTWLDCEVTKCNRSMVTGVMPNGDHFGHAGYLGDMQTGPFVAYGLSCDDPTFMQKSNLMFKYRSTDITERNLREIFHELEFGSKYTHQATNDIKLGCTIMQMSELKVIDNSNITAGKYSDECLHIDSVTITFQSLKQLDFMKHRDRYKNHFDIIYFANNCIKHIDKDTINHIAASECVLIIENQLFVVTHREKELQAYHKEVAAKLEGINIFECPFDINKDSYFKYVVK